MNAERWQEIQISFDQLVELDSSHRNAHLAMLARSDPELHRALESLLKSDTAASAQLAPIDTAFLPPTDRHADPLGLAGRIVSHFELREPLGAGGMGVVYRAHDARLGRVVALKFLLPHYSLDASAKARFLREARAAAALDHPNLCTIHEVGTSDEGWLFLAMALYQGETLRDRLTRTAAVPVRESVDIARQIAEGLQAAHAGGIVHRDLKPGNVMLLPDCTVRILDFGLAKARDHTRSGAGVRFGTVSYMSPEQIRGDNVDGRADLWALGVVLCEMLTGQKPFAGEEEVAIAHSILHDEPEFLRTDRSRIPVVLEEIVLRLLQKDPANRHESAAELLRELAPIRADAAESIKLRNAALSRVSLRRLTKPAVVQRPATGRTRQMLYGAGAVAALLTATMIAWIRPTPARAVVRSNLAFDATEALIQPVAFFWGRLALSPDGSRLAYVGGPRKQILVRERNQLHATAIAGSEGAETPFFSPDGQNVGFITAGNKLQIASLSGGPLVTVTDSVVGEAGASWGSDGYIYIDGRNKEPLIRVEAKAGAIPERFTTIESSSSELDHAWPEVLPNGKGILIAIGIRNAARAVGVVDIATRKHRVVLNNAVYARYVPTGHLLYVTNQRTLMIVPFDQNSMKVTGEPKVVAEGIRLARSSTVDVAVSDNGTLVYTLGEIPGKLELVWVTRDGKAQPMAKDWRGIFGEPSLSPDGVRLAVTLLPDAPYDSVVQVKDIWIKQLAGGPGTKLTLDQKTDSYAAWTPDGRSVTYSSDVAGSFDLWTKRADGGTQALLQQHETRGAFSPRWSPDGRWLVFRTDRSKPGAGDILGIRPGIDTVPIPLVATGFTESAPAISPDGRWLAYSSNESGKNDIYVVPFPNTASTKWAVSTDGGSEPLWSHSGKEIFYRDIAGNMVAVEVHSKPTFSTGRSTILFPAGAYLSFARGVEYAVAPDDRRFVMIRQVPSSVPDQLIVVDNWFEELKAKQR
jgi:eukaryotic-like serine/threonine-protein kinase